MGAEGLRASFETDAETVLVGEWKVAASVNRQPQSYELMDSDYLSKEPITIEVLKGAVGSVEMKEVEGVFVPLDLRGNRPTMRLRCVIDNVARAISLIQDSGARWTITTVRRATAE